MICHSSIPRPDRSACLCSFCFPLSSHFLSSTVSHLSPSLPADNTYLCLAVLDGTLCVIFLHGRNSPQSSPSATPCLLKSLSWEGPLEESEDRPLAPMHYARSGLGTAALEGRLIAAGQCPNFCQAHRGLTVVTYPGPAVVSAMRSLKLQAWSVSNWPQTSLLG